MTKYSLSLVVLAAFLAGLAAGVGGDDEPLQDSGRYGFDLSCRDDFHFLECRVVARDLVHGTVLAETVLGASASAEQGGGVSFEGHPAQGTPQRITLALHPQGTLERPERAMLDVHVHEGKHLVQRYTLTFPVAG